MKKLLIGLLCLNSIIAYAANEEKNLSLLLASSPKTDVAKVIAQALNSPIGKKVTIQNKCSSKELIDFEKDNGYLFEDCVFQINEILDSNFEESILISYQIQSGLSNGKRLNSKLNKSSIKILRAN